MGVVVVFEPGAIVVTALSIIPGSIGPETPKFSNSHESIEPGRSAKSVT